VNAVYTSVRSTVASFPVLVQIINVCMLTLGTLLLYSVKVESIRTMRVSPLPNEKSK
jgi:hypothetical protein